MMNQMSRKFLITMFVLLTSSGIYAQGWLWGKGNRGCGMDGWPIATDPNGNVFAGGITFATAPVIFGSDTIPGFTHSPQSVIAKYNPSGNFLWARATQGGSSYIINICTDPQGNSFMLGGFGGRTIQIGSLTLLNATGNAQYFLAKIDPSGNVLWANNWDGQQISSSLVGGISYVLSIGGVTTDASGNIYITTNFQNAVTTVGAFTLTNTDASGKTDDILVAKYDPLGSVVWAKCYGGTGNDNAYGITVAPSGDIYLSGVYNSPSLSFGTSVLTSSLSGFSRSAFIARLDASGNGKWAGGSGGNGSDYAIGIASDGNSNIYLTGGFKEHSIAFSGTIIANPTPGKAALYLAKFDPANNVSWFKTIGSADLSPPSIFSQSGAWGYSIAMSQCGVIWVSGAFNDSINIDGNILKPFGLPGMQTQNDPIFIAGYTSNGTYAGSDALSSGGDDQNGIACDAVGNVYMCSDYWSDYPFISGKDTLAVDSAAGEIMFVAKYHSLNKDPEITTAKSTLCFSEDLVLQASDGYESYFWSDGFLSENQHILNIGTYWVSGSNYCTSFHTDTFEVRACECSSFVFVPNSFSPNGDGHNDVFYPRCSSAVSGIESFRVYNRWGELMFQREHIAVNDRSNAWDGTFNGQKPLPEVYVWVVEGICSESGRKFNKKGNVTIVK